MYVISDLLESTPGALLHMAAKFSGSTYFNMAHDFKLYKGRLKNVTV